MSTENDGGPAFPQSQRPEECGMSLRDYFAVKAMAAMLTKPIDFHYAQVADAAYQVADAMLEARSK